jgi:AcrR family transcriptional regulator
LARAKNPRGSGARLRAELVEAANAVLDRTGDPASVTVRGVAAAVGVAPNAVYLHFPDRDSLLVALVEDRFAAFGDAIRAAIEAAGDDPVERIRAGHAAYVDFALAHPGHYRLLFGGVHVDPARTDLVRRARDVGLPAVELLVDCCRDLVGHGLIGPADPWRLATSVWSFEHGYVQLVLTMRTDLLPSPLEALDVLLIAMMRK